MRTRDISRMVATLARRLAPKPPSPSRTFRPPSWRSWPRPATRRRSASRLAAAGLVTCFWITSGRRQCLNQARWRCWAWARWASWGYGAVTVIGDQLSVIGGMDEGEPQPPQTLKQADFLA